LIPRETFLDELKAIEFSTSIGWGPQELSYDWSGRQMGI
jgi:hypothetical protein